VLLAHLLHIRPWEIDLLTIDQFERACAWIQARLDHAEQAQKGVGAGG
jgi:hypothetical protein